VGRGWGLGAGAAPFVAHGLNMAQERQLC